MSDWDVTTDLLVIGSGAGVTAALRATAQGHRALVVEKTELFGGSTCMSGGILWLPNNPVMRRDGVPDSREDALRYFETAVGEVGPASSPQRRAAFVDGGSEMVDFLEREGIEFRRCEGYSDYYAGVRGIEGGSARGRSLETKVFDRRRLGEWQHRVRPGFSPDLNIYTVEAAALSRLRTWTGIRTVLRAGIRTVVGRLLRQKRVTNGEALMSRLLQALLRRNAEIWLDSAVTELVVEDGRVVGAVVAHEGRPVRVRAEAGVVIAAGGFARNERMRQEFSGERRPVTDAWTSANPGDTGEVIRMARDLGAATDMLDEAWWMPSWFLADGTPMMCLQERTKPHSIIVDATGSRYFNEASSYQEAGQRMYERERTAGGAIPSWLIVDQWHRNHYTFMSAPPGRTPSDWLETGAMKRADTLEDLAATCGIDPEGLRTTVERFNGFARAGVDEDFHRGEGDHERFYGDVTHRPNACLGPIEKGPFYAVALYPGDIGTSGGLLCDEHSRVLREDGEPIPGLYATGNSTASVMGRTYPGAGASIAASAVFGYLAAGHACAGSEVRS